MIYTVTLNPSIDYIVHTDSLALGELNRMTSDIKLPGGKGINVSRILKRIGNETTALGFLGGFTGRFIQDWIQEEGIINKFTPIKDDTRINIKLKSDTETEINGAGPSISNEEKDELLHQLANLTSDDLVVLAGSTPPSLNNGFYQELITVIRQKGANFVIDTTGDDLIQALEYQPFLIKPNRDELAELFGVKLETIADIIPYGEKLLTMGAQNVIISMAGDGALFFTGNKHYQTNVLKRTVKNSVGAGDSMIAGFVGTYEKTNDFLEAFKMGVASGSATTFSDDLAEADFIKELYNEVTITEI